MILLARGPQDRDGEATRQEILTTLRHEPGLTKSQLARRLGLSRGTTWHHVRRLEQAGLVLGRNLFGWTGLYSAETPRIGMLVLPLLRDEETVALLKLLQDRPGLRIQEAARLSTLTRKQVRRRFANLELAGLLDRSPDAQARFSLRPGVLEMARRQTGADIPELTASPAPDATNQHGPDQHGPTGPLP